MPGDGEVRIRWQQSSDDLTLEIIDSGSGLPHSENLFVPFFTTKPGGSGILHGPSPAGNNARGGSLSLENREDAQGCVARVILPL